MESLPEKPSIKEMFESGWNGCTLEGLPKDEKAFVALLETIKRLFPNPSRTNSVRDFCDNGVYKIMFNNEEIGHTKRGAIFTSIIIRILEELKKEYPDIEILVY